MKKARGNEHPRNAESAAFKTAEPGSNVTRERVLQLQKQHSEIVSIDEGMQIEASDTQFSNADSPRSERHEPGSKVTVERLVQSAKHDLQMLSIDEGIQIDSSDAQPSNAETLRLEI
jgi:anti-sigma regulatory factor (Ser/Thr protein kinase)